MTIAEAAAEVLRVKSMPLSIEEIVDDITELNLYSFNSEDKVSIVREQVRRHCYIPNKKIQYDPLLFMEASNSKYQLMDNEVIPKNVSYRRVRRAKDKEPLIEKLTKKGEGKFGEIWKLMFFAACLGLNRKKKESITEYDTGRSIDFSYFGGNPSWPGILHLIGLVEEGDPRILNPDQDKIDHRIELFEEYCNGGMSIMMQEMEGRDFSLDALLSLLPIDIDSLNITESPVQI
jgi:dnd system-associated protein 4